jgi:hypothetical protein
MQRVHRYSSIGPEPVAHELHRAEPNHPIQVNPEVTARNPETKRECSQPGEAYWQGSGSDHDVGVEPEGEGLECRA